MFDIKILFILIYMQSTISGFAVAAFFCPVVDFSRQENWNFTIFNTFSIRFLTFTAVRL